MGNAQFDAKAPLGFSVTCTESRWNLIASQKHPAMAGRQDDVRRTIEDPDQIRLSRQDPKVYLFYRGGPSR